MIHALFVLGCLFPPVDGVIVDHFREPACAFCAGNRGLEYRIDSRQPVHAAAAGEVTFAGSVAGVRYAVIRHADGSRTTSGKLDSITVRAGQRVSVGETIGWVSTELYFGLRVGEDYVDPEPLLGMLTRAPRLVPIDGTPPRPPPPPRLTCAGGDARAAR